MTGGFEFNCLGNENIILFNPKKTFSNATYKKTTNFGLQDFV